ncbi:MAG: hypothetical protein K6E16_04975 [Lachnospiraceae bacterium]|nr:hypothetical protein [Lachnospiraceae bacterium]
MNLSVLIEMIEAQVSAAAFVRQALTILLLTVYGYVLVSALCSAWSFRRRILFSYPAGLSAFSIIAFLLVILKIPYGTATVVVAALAVLFVLLVTLFFTAYQKDLRRFSILWECRLIEALVAIVLVDFSILLSCSGLLKVAISNDSMFNYTFYPDMIVHYGGLRSNFNTFLTDVGPGSAMIGTLPFLFGFQEMFGLQHMLNLDFLAIFYVALYEKCNIGKKWIKVAVPLLGVALLSFTTPYLLISKWILANDYFAVYMFFCVHLAEAGSTESATDEEKSAALNLLYLFLAVLSLLRIEGGVYVILFVILSSVRKISRRQLVCGMLLPAMFLQTLYAFRIFVTMEIIAPYRFLTEEKVLLMFAAMVLALVYLLLIRDRFLTGMQKHFGLWILVGLLGINLLLCIREPTAYLENMNAFVRNILHEGGWGIFPATVAVLYLLSVNKAFRFHFYDLMAFAYFFYALAVSFMREGGLQTGPGDSGNRVLLQAVPLLLFAALIHIIKALSGGGEIAEEKK